MRLFQKIEYLIGITLIKGLFFDTFSPQYSHKNYIMPNKFFSNNVFVFDLSLCSFNECVTLAY